MTKYLVSAENPSGSRTEDILGEIRADLIERMVPYRTDPRRELKTLLANNVRILVLLSEAIELAEENTRVLKSDPPH
jgi:hypothetical protein